MAKTPTLAEAPEPLPTRVVDNHTHLESIPARLGQEPAAGEVDVTEYLTAAHAVGVDRIVQVGCDVESARASLDMPSGPAARLRVGVALHPNEVVAHHRVREESPDGLEPTFLARHEIRHKRTRPFRPQTNGKAERFIQTLINEWAYARPYRSNGDRLHALRRFVDFYNRGRPHTAIGGLVPHAVVNNVLGQHS